MKLRLFTLLTLVASLCSSSLTHAADSIPAEKRLPPNVLAFISCPDVVDLQSRLRDTSFGEMLQDPEMDKFKAELIAKFDELSKSAEENIGMPLGDVIALLSGEAAMAVIRPLGQAPGAVALLDCGDHEDVVKQLLGKAEEELTKRDAKKEIEDVDGTEVIIFTIPARNANSQPGTITYFFKDQTLVIGSSFAVLENVLERWDGSDANCFAESELYKSVLTQCVPDPDGKPVLKWFITPIELVMAGLSMSPETQMYAGIGSAYLPTLGLNKLKAFGGATEMATEQYDAISRTVVITNPPAAGLIKVFQFPDTLTGPPEWVPADAAQYIGMHWDIDGAYTAIGSLYDTFQGAPGAWEQLIDNLSEQPGNPGLHIKKDFIDTLTGQVQGYMLIPPGADVNAPDFQPQGIVAIGIRDVAKAENLLEKLMSSKDDITNRDFMGTKIYEIPGDRTAAVAIAQDHIFIAENATRLEAAIIGRTGNPLVKTPGYAAMAAHMPEKMSMTSWVDASLQWEAGYDKLRTGAYDNALENILDPKSLPPFSVLKKYMRPTASYMVPTANGSMTVNISLRPERN